EFTKLNPIGYAPVLVDGDLVLSDSFAILLAANIVSSSIQPLQNLATLKYIKDKVSPDEQLAFSKHHIEKGFTQFHVLSRLNEANNEIPAFQDAMPEKQPDTPLTSAS
ncbi:glutathione s-transferase zeta class, partial [Quercus suber]